MSDNNKSQSKNENTRRDFLKWMGVGAGSLVINSEVSAESARDLDPDRYGVLSDLTLCIGCRRCEWACAEENGLPNQPLKTIDDPSVFKEFRRPTPTQYTVVNRYPEKNVNGKPLDVKVQCMHCEHPACVSACIVGALEKDSMGPVKYDTWKCIGCRYCMVACPFQIPTYEYENALTPEVQKCTLCFTRTIEEGRRPACVDICPRESIIFGKRRELLEIAHERIRRHPDRYVDHVYGEQEAGGTSWLYLSSAPFEDVGLPELSPRDPAAMTEKIQHGIFKGFTGPIMLFGFLSILMKLFRKEESHE